MKDAQRRLDRLLTGNPSLSVQEREDLLERIIVPRREPRVGRQMWLWASACAAVVAVVALLPVVLREREMVSDDFRARGGRAANQASFHVTCAGGAARPDSDHARCQPGDTLAFDLMPPSDGAYFAAAALRDDGLIVWYFPDDDGNCLRVHAAGVADRGIVVGSEHPAGRYQVLGVFSPTPISRADIKNAVDGHDKHLHVLREPMEVVTP